MKLISGVFHPLLMTSYMSALLAIYVPEVFLPYPKALIWQLVLAFFILTAVFPSLIVFGIWMYTPLISDLELTNRKERILPFAVLIACYGLTGYIVVITLGLGWIVKVMLFSSIVLIALMLTINTRFKISIHASGVWALVGYALGLCIKFGLSDLLPAVWCGILIGGMISTSRLYLGYHRPSEVWLGTLLGFVFSLTTVLVLL